MIKSERLGLIKGFVVIRGFRDGKLVWEIKGPNEITYGIRDVLGELLLQTTLLPGARSTADLRLDTMKMGTSAASVTRSQTGLQSTPVVSKTLASANVSKSSAGVYVFSTTMSTAEGNGSTFQEVGLFTVDGTMLSRQVHSPYAKDNTLSVQYDYTYTFV